MPEGGSDAGKGVPLIIARKHSCILNDAEWSKLLVHLQVTTVTIGEEFQSIPAKKPKLESDQLLRVLTKKFLEKRNGWQTRNCFGILPNSKSVANFPSLPSTPSLTPLMSSMVCSAVYPSRLIALQNLLRETSTFCFLSILNDYMIGDSSQFDNVSLSVNLILMIITGQQTLIYIDMYQNLFETFRFSFAYTLFRRITLLTLKRAY
ncbi:hypothetical protein KQX54_008825 [Cotesia glomerata]|uniref:Uncharacterized protein n=1 Tax=Cotesia glomerata TaxID=32391 RepID=A0AAV7I202_COTGL|nr:hypothetical protein KQX54_008825 [Cotesia glomerata]